MQIALTTPSGNVGRHVVGDLVRAGARPRVMTRHVEPVIDAWGDLVDARRVDLERPGEVLEATEGVDALFVVVPASDEPDPNAAYARTGSGIAAAVAEHRIPRTVFQSSIGAELRHGAGEIDGLARCEEALDEACRSAGVAVTHLRCGYFFTNLLFEAEGLRAGVVNVVLPTDHPMPWVAPRDVAAVASALLLHADWTGRRVQAVHGPRDLTWDEAVAIASRATGTTARAEQIEDDQMRATLREAGLGEAQVEGILGMSTGIRDGFVPEQPRDPMTTTSTTLESWCYDVLRDVL